MCYSSLLLFITSYNFPYRVIHNFFIDFVVTAIVIWIIIAAIGSCIHLEILFSIFCYYIEKLLLHIYLVSLNFELFYSNIYIYIYNFSVDLKAMLRMPLSA